MVHRSCWHVEHAGEGKGDVPAGINSSTSPTVLMDLLEEYEQHDALRAGRSSPLLIVFWTTQYQHNTQEHADMW